MMHVNVIARNVDDPLCESFSWLSGRACPQGTHSFGITGGTCFGDSIENLEDSVTKVGDFVISSIPPGIYTIEVEEVVGDEIAQTLAPGLFNEYIYGDAEFWNEGDSANDPTYLTSSTITIAAGETREDIDIILNRNEVTEDRIKYIPLDTFTPGPGTRCPEESPVNYAQMIGIDDGGSTGNTGDTAGSTGSSSGGCSLVGETY
jgi:hypothetical protein